MDQQDRTNEIIPDVKTHLGPGFPSVDEISGVLSQTGLAMSLIQQSSYAPLLSTIAYVYNSSAGGSFGLFDPTLDKTVKWKLVQDELDKRGFQTEVRDGRLYAWSDEKSSEEVSAEMEQMFSDIDRSGGLVIGINAGAIRDVAEKDFKLSNTDGVMDEADRDTLVALHLASTIIHEAVHARGAEDESSPVSHQQAFTQEALRKINSDRVTAGKEPLNMTGEVHRAQGMGWYRKAQLTMLDTVLPEAFLRRNYEIIEPYYHVDKERNDSLETVLNKNIHTDVVTPIMEEALQKDWDKDEMASNNTLEELLDEKRPHPIIVPLSKSAAMNSNLGGPFISSPFSIDQNLVRVWDGNDIQDRIDYKEGEDPYWHTRYLPENFEWTKDRFGRPTYKYTERYKWVDYSNNNPQSWSQLFREDNVTGPWRKAAADEFSLDDEKNVAISILRALGYYKNLIKTGKKKAIRIVLDQPMLENAATAVADVNHDVFHNDDGTALWIYGPDVDASVVREAEEAVVSGEQSDLVDSLTGSRDDLEDLFNFVLSRSKAVADEYGLTGVYVVGGFPRTLVDTGDLSEVNDLDFTGSRPDECMKLGGILASELNAKNQTIFHRTMTLSYSYRGMKMDFRGHFVPFDVRPLLREHGIPTTPLNFDIYARDFTVNSLLYSFVDNKIYDVTGQGVADIRRKLIRTFFPPKDVLPLNPLVITRAIIMELRGWTIDPNLSTSMKHFADIVFSGQVSEERLAYEYEKIIKYEMGDELLKEYGLEKLKDIRDRVKAENPELFEEDK